MRGYSLFGDDYEYFYVELLYNMSGKEKGEIDKTKEQPPINVILMNYTKNDDGPPRPIRIKIPYSIDDPISLFKKVHEHSNNEKLTYKGDNEDDKAIYKEKLGYVVQQFSKLSNAYGEENIKNLYWKYLADKKTKMNVGQIPKRNESYYTFDYDFLKRFHKKIEEWSKRVKVNVIIKFSEKNFTGPIELNIGDEDSCWVIHNNLNDQMRYVFAGSTMDINHNKFVVHFNKKFKGLTDKQKSLIINESCNKFRLEYGRVFVSGEGHVIINYKSAVEICEYISFFELYNGYNNLSNDSVRNAINEHKARKKLKKILKNKLGIPLHPDVFTFPDALPRESTKLLDYLDKMYVIDEEKYKQIEDFPNSPTEENTKDYNMKKLYTRGTELRPVLIHFNPKYRDHLDEISFLKFDENYNIIESNARIQLIKPLIVQPENF